MKLTVVLSPAEDTGYTVVCPAFLGAVTEGESLEEALANMKDAAEGWLLSWLEDGYPTPVETPEMVQEEIDLCLADRAEEGLPPVVETREIEVADPEDLAERAILDEDCLLEYAQEEGLLEDEGDIERALKPCTLRALIRHAGVSMDEFLELLNTDEER